jgi:hypothetical protein
MTAKVVQLFPNANAAPSQPQDSKRAFRRPHPGEKLEIVVDGSDVGVYTVPKEGISKQRITLQEGDRFVLTVVDEEGNTTLALGTDLVLSDQVLVEYHRQDVSEEFRSNLGRHWLSFPNSGSMRRTLNQFKGAFLSFLARPKPGS